MKSRVSTSISLHAEYWAEHVEPLLKNGFSIVGLFILGVEEAKKIIDSKKNVV